LFHLKIFKNNFFFGEKGFFTIFDNARDYAKFLAFAVPLGRRAQGIWALAA